MVKIVDRGEFSKLSCDSGRIIKNTEKAVSDHINALSSVDKHLHKMQDVYKNRMYELLLEREGLRTKCEDSLMFFLETFWKYVEPATPFVKNWHIEAICEHLEAVTHGEINRLLINVPPGMLKSLLVDVFWPAWEWIHFPANRFLCTSYSQSLTERDNIRFRNVIMSPEYRTMWGHKFGPSKDSFSVVKVANDKTGWKLATSTGGTGTGERGDRVICFSYDELVATENGRMKIGDIVEKNINVRAWSYNETTGKMELRKITKKFKNPSSPLLKITMEDGTSVKCTYDHKILSSWGYMPAKNLVVGNLLLAAPRWMQFPSLDVTIPKFETKVFPDSTISNAGNSFGTDSVFDTQRFGGIISSRSDLFDHFFGEMRSTVFERSMSLTIVDILKSSSVFKIVGSGISSIAVFMSDLLSFRARTNKGGGNNLMNESVDTLTSAAHCYSGITFIEKRSHCLSGNAQGMTVANGDSRNALNSSDIGNNIQSLESYDIYPSFLRIKSIEAVHEIPPFTYCLTVEDNHNLCCGDVSSIICSNCDDPHNVKDGESELVRRSTLQYFTEVLPTRLNSPINSAIVVIMQRVNEEDVSGYIISKDLGYTHLMLPMRFDPSRKCVTELGFEDPRTEEGELLFPERMPENVVQRDEKVMGSYAVAGQFQQMPTPRGGGIIKEKWWKMYPEYPEAMDEEGKPINSLEYPDMEFIVAFADTAYTTKETNDYSALTIWGVWRKDGAPKIMLMAGWKERLELNDLVKKINRSCSRPHGIPVDRLLIENKASGKSVQQELLRLFEGSHFAVETVEPKGDKESRMYAVSGLFENGMIHAPDRGWSQMVIDDTSKFPKGAHDDIPDTVSGALMWLRNCGFALRSDEYDNMDLESRILKAPDSPLYDV